jgi:cysteinyl-tRNA synthetase
MAVRYWLLTGHYRTQMNFTWDALEGAQVALMRLYAHYSRIIDKDGVIDFEYKRRFVEAINDDLDTPKAIAIVWELVKDEEISPANKRVTLSDFDKVLGLGLSATKKEFEKLIGKSVEDFLGMSVVKNSELPEKVQELLKERDNARTQKDFKEADRLRGEIEGHGYELKDTEKGTEVLDKNAGV